MTAYDNTTTNNKLVVHNREWHRLRDKGYWAFRWGQSLAAVVVLRPRVPLFDTSQCIVHRMTDSYNNPRIWHAYSIIKAFTSIGWWCWPEPTVILNSGVGLGVSSLKKQIVETKIQRVDKSTCPVENTVAVSVIGCNPPLTRSLLDAIVTTVLLIKSYEIFWNLFS